MSILLHRARATALAIGATFTIGLAATPVNAAENPFGMTDLSSGYMQVASAGDKGEEGKCGEGKCGGDKSKDGDADKGEEGKCGGDKGKDGDADKGAEGKCGGDKDKDDKDDKDDDGDKDKD